jgi:RNA polymerase sigma-70 factor (ECF subfamily)
VAFPIFFASPPNRPMSLQSKGQMDVSDAAAITLALAGDGDAFRILVERHSRGVFRLAYRMTGNEFDADDVVQETFLRACRQLKQYESKSSFSTWLYRIAANYSLDLLRSRRRHEDRHISPTADGVDMLDNISAKDPGQDRVYFSQEIKRKLDSALAELSDQERTAFTLRHFEGMSIDEIGQVLNIGTSATKNSIFRAVAKLRGALQPLTA